MIETLKSLIDYLTPITHTELLEMMFFGFPWFKSDMQCPRNVAGYSVN